MISSDSNVAPIVSNSCATTLLNDTQPSCTFYVSGNSSGSANITITAPNYESIVQPLTITRQWGTFSGQPLYNTGVFYPSQITFGGGYVYAFGTTAIARSNGGAWQDVGDGEVVTPPYIQNPIMVSDDTHVCVGMTLNDSAYAGEVKCSKSNSAWQTLPIINGQDIDNITLYQDNLYVLADSSGDVYRVMLCPVDDCINWQQIGESFTSSSPVASIFFESAAFVQNSTGVYYQLPNGSWQLYGSYIDDHGVFLAVSDLV